MRARWRLKPKPRVPSQRSALNHLPQPLAASCRSAQISITYHTQLSHFMVLFYPGLFIPSLRLLRSTFPTIPAFQTDKSAAHIGGWCRWRFYQVSRGQRDTSYEQLKSKPVRRALRCTYRPCPHVFAGMPNGVLNVAFCRILPPFYKREIKK